MWTVLAWAAVAVSGAGLVWLSAGWWRIVHCAAPTAGRLPPATVCISLHNEAPNIPRLFPPLLQQSHPELRVLAVDDRSTDGTGHLLDTLAAAHPHLQVLHVQATPPGYAPKKHALAQAIAAAGTECLLFTDADCAVGRQWAECLATELAAHDIILGYGAYEVRPGVLNRMVRYDSLLLAAQYLGSAAAGMPYMAVGRNLAYRRSVYAAANGFASHAHVLSGDDDLLVNRTGRRWRIGFALAEAACTRSLPPDTWRQWRHQKRRHLSAANHYRPHTAAVLAAWALALPGLYLALGYGVAAGNWLLACAAGLLLALRWMGVCWVCRYLREPLPAWQMPVLDVLWLLWQVRLALAWLSPSQKHWAKART